MSRTVVMGILNITPDSFADGGKYLSKDDAVTGGRRLVVEGADIVDVGGESTRPGAERVSEVEELKRVIPVIKALEELGISIEHDGRYSLPLKLHGTGKIPGGALTIDASASSQFLSALLLVAPSFGNGIVATRCSALQLAVATASCCNPLITAPEGVRPTGKLP